MMKKMCIIRGLAVMALGLVVASCSKLEDSGQTVVSKEEAKANAEEQLGITIDPNQDWKMTRDIQANVSVNLGTGEDYTLILFDKSPFVYDDAVYYAKQEVSDGSNVSLDLTVPSALTNLYITVLDKNGLSYSKRKLISENTIDAAFEAESANARELAMRRANTGETYNETSTGINANANEWADPTPGKTFGGWVVPDPLTEDQKAVVKAYFQAIPNLTYNDPQWRHFFVQQVYKGGDDKPETGNKETNKGADNSSYTSSNMNQLTVGYNNQHINNFNGADGSNTEVLDNGYTANDFNNHKHNDQIMLMVNIDDTECMGYHNSGCSQQKNDKAALVDWTEIRDWANSNNLNGDCLDDGWGRSFVGFDFELYSLEDSYAKDGNGDKIYAKFADGQNNNLQYVWDGQNVVNKTAIAQKKDLDITNHEYSLWNADESVVKNSDGTLSFHTASWGGLCYSFSDENLTDYSAVVIEFDETTTVATQLFVRYGNQWSQWERKEYANPGVNQIEMNITGDNNFEHVTQIAIQAADSTDLKINRFYLKGQEGVEGYGDYLLVNGQQVPFLIANRNMYGGTMYNNKDEGLNDSDMRIEKDGKQCFNMEKIKELVEDGYLPVKDKNLRSWVKWEGGDGYFSDWIVTLSQADRIQEQETHTDPPVQNPAIYSYAFEDTYEGDYDLNDVVLKAQENGDDIDITLVAAGATLDLNIRLYDYDENGTNGYGNSYVTLSYNNSDEVHGMLGVDRGIMVNTGGGGSNCANTDVVPTFTVSKSSYDVSKLRLAIYSDSEGEVRLSGSGDTPHGVLIPADWQWPTECTHVNSAYNNKNTYEEDADQSFSTFASQAGKAEKWYNYPTGNVMY